MSTPQSPAAKTDEPTPPTDVPHIGLLPAPAEADAPDAARSFAQRLRRALVGSPRETAARYRLDGVAEVQSWLERLCART